MENSEQELDALNFRRQLKATIAAATSLQQLCDILNEAMRELKEARGLHSDPGSLYLSEMIDLTSLPNFSDHEPSETEEKWSWDDESFLRQSDDHNRGYYLEARDDIEEKAA